MRNFLGLVRRPIGIAMDQWYLITIALEAQLKVPPGTWSESFRKVNLHPDDRVPFDEWMRILDRRGVLTNTSQAFFDGRTTLYDAMPALWKHLSVTDRQSVIDIIDKVYSTARPGDRVWTKKNVLDLAKFVGLDEVFKLRACYIAAKKDPSVIERLTEEKSVVVDEQDNGPHGNMIDKFFSWRPEQLMQSYVENRDDDTVRWKYFNHLTNHVARLNWSSDKPVQPSAYLDAAMSATQSELLNPQYKHVLTGHILYDCKGKGAVQKIAKRRLDMIEGNVASYSRCLNNATALQAVKEVNQLVSAVADVSADLENEKKRKAHDKKEAAEKKKRKKQLQKEQAAKKKDEALPVVNELMLPFVNGNQEPTLVNFKAMKVAQLKDILKYYFNFTTALSSLGKDKCAAKIVDLFQLRQDKNTNNTSTSIETQPSTANNSTNSTTD